MITLFDFLKTDKIDGKLKIDWSSIGFIKIYYPQDNELTNHFQINPIKRLLESPYELRMYLNHREKSVGYYDSLFLNNEESRLYLKELSESDQISDFSDCISTYKNVIMIFNKEFFYEKSTFKSYDGSLSLFLQFNVPILECYWRTAGEEEKKAFIVCLADLLLNIFDNTEELDSYLCLKLLSAYGKDGEFLMDVYNQVKENTNVN